MKYYCKACGSEFEPGDKMVMGHKIYQDYSAHECPFCDALAVYEIPAFETVSQWEKRTGRKYPDTAPVYVLYTQLDTETGRRHFWELCKNGDFIDLKYVVVATEAGAPPDDWKPDERV